MGKLQAFRAMHGHEANSVLAFIRLQRDHASGLTEVSEIVDQFFQFDGLVDLFRLPHFYELQGRLKNGRGGIQSKVLHDDVERDASFRVAAADFFARALDRGQYVGSTLDLV